MSKEQEKKEDCIHIGIVICDTGFSTTEERRDIGLKCEDCGLEWNTHFYRGKLGASIEPRLILDKVLDVALGKPLDKLER